MKTREIMEMNLNLRSKTNVELKPDYMFTGGIEVTTKDGKKYCLDFNDTVYQKATLKKGICHVEVTQKWLNHTYMKEESNYQEIEFEKQIDIQFLVDNAASIEVYFESEAKNEEEYESKFEVVSCTFTALDEFEAIDFSKITTLQLD